MSRLYSLQDESSLAVQLERAHRDIYSEYNRQQEREQLRREILADCEKLIEQRVNLQIDNQALPKLRELDAAIKSLGRM